MPTEVCAEDSGRRLVLRDSCYNTIGGLSEQLTGGFDVILYIWGNLTSDNFTPRPKDTTGLPGQKAGLSAWKTITPGKKAQGIDTDKLKRPLMAIPDDEARGGLPGHFAIAPVDETGEIDTRRLEEWAGSRGTGQTHEFTQIVLDAVVEPNVEGGGQ